MSELLPHLKGVEPAPAGFTAFCPAHNGHDRTLRIRSGPDGQVHLDCSRGCSEDQIFGPLGLQSPKASRFNGISLPPELLSAAKKDRPSDQIATNPRILDAFAAELRASGVAGEERTGKLTYLVLTTRLLDSPVSAIVKGPSSAGKSRIVEQTLKFFPPSAFYQWTSMSTKAPAYDEEPISHRFIVLYEATPLKDSDSAYMMRSLLTEGRLRHMTVERENGRQKIRKIDREGPTGLISTTTEISLDPELETRCLSIPIDDSPAQTRRVLIVTAQEANRKIAPPNVEAWIDFQKWIETAEHRVQIPFAEKLAAAIDPRTIRLRRDFGKVISLIKAHAILHQRNRERDRDGEIIATLEDYEVVRLLVDDLLSESIGKSISPTLSETIAAVRDAIQESPEDTITVTDVAHVLGLDPSTTWRRIQEAIARGYISNLEPAPRRPAKLALKRSDVPDGSTNLLPEARCFVDESMNGSLDHISRNNNTTTRRITP